MCGLVLALCAGWAIGAPGSDQDAPPAVAELAGRLLGSPLFCPGEFAAPTQTVRRVLDSQDGVARFLRSEFGPDECRQVGRLATGRDRQAELPVHLAVLLNRVLESDVELFTPARFAGVSRSEETARLLNEAATAGDRLLRRRRLLEDYFGDAVRRFRAPSYQGKQSRGWLEVHRFGGSAGTAEFDSATGQLAALYLEPLATLDPPMGLAHAERSASAWLSEAGLSLQGWTRVQAEQTPSRNGRLGYRFVWRRRTADGVGLPALTTVDTDAAGQVVGVLRVDRPAAIDTTPVVGRAQAERVARGAIGQPAAVLESAVTEVWFGEHGQQELRWRLALSHGVQRRIVLVNARTGAVLHVAGAEDGRGRLSAAESLAVVRSLAEGFSTVEVLTALGPDGEWWRQAGSSPKAPEVRVVGTIGSDDEALAPAIAAGLAAALPQARTGVRAEIIPWFWLRWHEPGTDAVTYSGFYPPDGLLQFEMRQSGAGPSSPSGVPGAMTETSVACTVPETFTQAVLEALEPDLRAQVRRSLPRRRAPVVPMIVALAAVAVLGTTVVALARRRSLATGPP